MRNRIYLAVLLITFSFMVFGTPTYTWAAPYAYITNYGDNTVSVIDMATNAVIGAPIVVGGGPYGIAVNAAGTRVYVANHGSGTVSVIDTSTNTVVGSPIAVGSTPYGLAVSPDGTHVYVANSGSNSVSVIDTTTNTVIGSPISVGNGPLGIVVNPAGTGVYVTNSGSNSVSVIDTSTNTVVGSPISVGSYPYGITVNPAGTRVYVTNYTFNGTVSVIDTSTNTVVDPPISVGSYPIGIALNRAGTRVYTANEFGSNSVSVIDTSTNGVVGLPIPVGSYPCGIAVNPAGTGVYVTNQLSNSVSVIDTSTNTVVGSPIAVGTQPLAFGQFIGAPSVPLFAGWNFISLPKAPPNSDIASVLADVSSNVHIVWGWDNRNQLWKKWTPAGGLSNAFSSMEMGNGYWIYMKNPGAIDMSQWAPVASFLPANFYPKWNLIGYNGTNGLSVGDALQAISGQRTSIWNWTAGTWYTQHTAIPGFPPPIEALASLNQGKAYWVKMKDSYTPQSAIWDTSAWDNCPWGS